MMVSKSTADDRIEGNGVIVLHNARLDVDVSVRLSELVREIAALKEDVESLKNNTVEG